MPIYFQLYQVATEPTCPIWTGSSVVEQMPAKGMVVSSSLTRSVGFPTAWPLCGQRRKLNTYFQIPEDFYRGLDHVYLALISFEYTVFTIFTILCIQMGIKLIFESKLYIQAPIKIFWLCLSVTKMYSKLNTTYRGNLFTLMDLKEHPWWPDVVV